MRDYVNPRWRAILAHNGIEDFEALWSHPADWFEAPNQRRGGWSGVARCELALPDGGRTAIFLKRQENHGTRTLRYPVHGVPTFLREFQRIMAYRNHAIPSLEPVFFGMRLSGSTQRAILATEELSGFESLSDYVHRWSTAGMPPRAERLAVVAAVAQLLRKMHRHHIRHGCFFPKHVFVKVLPEGAAEARVIDLEKSRWHPLREQCAVRDLYSLSHYSQGAWSRTERLRFFLTYLGVVRLNARGKRLWRKVAAYIARKHASRGG